MSDTALLEPKDQIRFLELTRFEREVNGKGFKAIAGIDEAGRGPLAGPVVAASCIIPEGLFLPGINDSKILSPKERARLFREIIGNTSISYGIGIVEHYDIDEFNIYRATIMAMNESIKNNPGSPDYLLIDGLPLPGFSLPNTAIVKGDSKSISIAGASVIAKETRDALMIQYHDSWPEYGFNAHKGYGTAFHIEAIKKYGPCPIHRKSFEPVKSLLLKN